MSRCFPYPPPEMLREGARGETVNRPIKKHQKEKVKSYPEQKKDFLRQDKDTSKHCTGYSKKDLSNNFSKRVEDEAEKSDITEEHGQCASVQSLNCLSDGAQSGNKRKRNDSVVTIGKSRSGTLIRLRLPFQKGEEPFSSVGVRQPCSTAGSTSLPRKIEVSCSPVQHKPLSTDFETSIDGCNLKPRLESERTLQPDSCNDDNEASCSVSLHEDPLESQYRTLFETLAPPSLKFEPVDSDDQDWLFGCKTSGCRKPNGGLDVSLCESADLWPRAKYVPEAEIYALPYTIPF